MAKALKPYNINPDEKVSEVPTAFKNWPSLDEAIENLRKLETQKGEKKTKADIIRFLIILGFNVKVTRLTLDNQVIRGNTIF